MLLEYIFRAIGFYILEMHLVNIHPELLKFLEQRGEYQASNGVKIISGSKLELGPPDGTTGYPRYIKGLGRSIGHEDQKSEVLFYSNEQRARYAYGLRTALVELLRAYKFTVDGYEYSLPYAVILM